MIELKIMMLPAVLSITTYFFYLKRHWHLCKSCYLFPKLSAIYLKGTLLVNTSLQ